MIGWTDEGIAYYNELYSSVREDRAKLGDVFCAEMLKLYSEQTQDFGSRRNVVNGEPRKRRRVAFNDLSDISQIINFNGSVSSENGEAAADALVQFKHVEHI
ncbi:MAG: hypothetical protein ACRC1D_02525 [Culicoidibacterales bacterium]